MTNKDPPQWAIDRAQKCVQLINIYRDHPATGGYWAVTTPVNVIAVMLVEEREKCAKICDAEARRLSDFQDIAANPMISTAESLARKIRAQDE